MCNITFVYTVLFIIGFVLFSAFPQTAFVFWYYCLFITYGHMLMLSNLSFIQRHGKVFNIIVCILFIAFTLFFIQYTQNYNKCDYSPHKYREYCN